MILTVHSDGNSRNYSFINIAISHPTEKTLDSPKNSEKNIHFLEEIG